MLAIVSEFKADLHAAIALGLRAFGFEGTGSTVEAFIETALGEIAVFGFVRFGFEVDHTLLRRAD